MKTLKISFLKSTPDFGRNGIYSLLKERYRIIEDDKDFDYLIATPWMYILEEASRDFWERFPGHITIMYGTHEAVAPDFMLFDYYIGIDTGSSSERTIRLPGGRWRFRTVHGSKQGLDTRALLASKTAFCNYIYSNGDAHPNRELMFHKLSDYQFVHSLGRHLNNTKCDDSFARDSDDWYAASIQLKKPYKFSIAFENAWYLGYTTEKIISSMQAGSIPIYWGNPKIGEEFNTASFINCHDFSSLDEVVEYVKKVDNDDDLWCEIMSRPWKTPEQEELFDEETERETRKLYKVFDQDLTDAPRKGEGTWVWAYRRWLQRGDFQSLVQQEAKRRHKHHSLWWHIKHRKF